MTVDQVALRVLFDLRESLSDSARTQLSFAGRLLARNRSLATGKSARQYPPVNMAFWKYLLSANCMGMYAQ